MFAPVRLLALLTLTISTSAALAQSPSAFPVAPEVISPEWMSSFALTTRGTCDAAPAWHIDLLLGLPLGLRAQHYLGESPWLCEGFLGLVGISPSVGAGIRREFVVVQGSYGSLMVNPGIDAYLGYAIDLSGIGNASDGGQGHSGPATYLAGNVDVAWTHKLGGGNESRLGVELGGVVGSRGVLPCISLFFGWGF